MAPRGQWSFDAGQSTGITPLEQPETTTIQPAIDQAQMEAFVGKVLADTAGTTTTVLAAIGDHLGLFKDVAAHGRPPAPNWQPAQASRSAMPRVARRHG